MRSYKLISRFKALARTVMILGATLQVWSCTTGTGPGLPLFDRKIGPEGISQISLGGTWKMKPGNLAPSNFYLPHINDASWQDIHIPSNWYLKGLDTSGVVWFRKHFSIDLIPRDQVATLIFQGVDYAADVWLNGKYLGFHEGYFNRFSFKVSDLLVYGEDNILAVRVNSPDETPGAWSLNKRLIKGVFSHHDTRPGGAWSSRGQEKNTGGIWAPVHLKISRSLAIDHMTVTPVLARQKAVAKVKIQTDVTLAEVEGPQGFGKVTAQIIVRSYNFQTNGQASLIHRSVRVLNPGPNRINIEIPVPNARFWWPWEMGKPNLYQAVFTLYKNNQVLDTASRVFGFRDVWFDTSTMIWHINGKRLFLRGTNYISTQWLSEMTPQRYSLDLELMKEAHINIVRVHAHVEAPEFYRLCNEKGILVWQDFPLQWGYTDDKIVKTAAVTQAKEMVDLLCHHPAIVAWCGHNEPPWDAKWMQYKYENYSPGQNQALNDAVFMAFKASDDSRYVHKYSSTAEHPWFGWYSGSWKDYGKPAVIPMISEFGAQALPDYQTLSTIFPKDKLWPESEKDWKTWQYHNFQPKETFKIAGVQKGNTIHEFIFNTQQYQAKLIKYAAESYRRQRFSPVTGIFQFMFNETWPSVNWGVLDYLRHPKPGYHALQAAYQPLLPSIESKADDFRADELVTLKLWVINDLHKEVKNAGLEYRLKSGSTLVDQGRIDLDILPDSGTLVETFFLKKLSPGLHLFEMVIKDSNKIILAQNYFSFNILAKGEK